MPITLGHAKAGARGCQAREFICHAAVSVSGFNSRPPGTRMPGKGRLFCLEGSRRSAMHPKCKLCELHVMVYLLAYTLFPYYIYIKIKRRFYDKRRKIYLLA